jgi:hypothetical protein
LLLLLGCHTLAFTLLTDVLLVAVMEISVARTFVHYNVHSSTLRKRSSSAPPEVMVDHVIAAARRKEDERQSQTRAEQHAGLLEADSCLQVCVHGHPVRAHERLS